MTTEKLNKEVYLKLRAQGKTHDQIERELDLSKGTLSAYCLRKWDLKGVTAEKARELLGQVVPAQEETAIVDQTGEVELLMIELNEAKRRIADYESKLARWAQQDADNTIRIAELQEDVTSWKKRCDEYKYSCGGIVSSEAVVQTAVDNPVQHPSHYTAGGIETIDFIRAKLTQEEFRGYCKGNVLKYVTRERWKGKDEDLHKSMKYLEFVLATGN